MAIPMRLSLKFKYQINTPVIAASVIENRESIAAERDPKSTAIVCFDAARSARRSGMPESVMAAKVEKNNGMLTHHNN